MGFQDPEGANAYQIIIIIPILIVFAICQALCQDFP